MKTLLYYIVSILFLLFQGICMAFAGIYRLWEYFHYQVQCLRYPPPPGGMYGNMARVYKNKDHRR